MEVDTEPRPVVPRREREGTSFELLQSAVAAAKIGVHSVYVVRGQVTVRHVRQVIETKRMDEGAALAIVWDCPTWTWPSGGELTVTSSLTRFQERHRHRMACEEGLLPLEVVRDRPRNWGDA